MIIIKKEKKMCEIERENSPMYNINAFKFSHTFLKYV